MPGPPQVLGRKAMLAILLPHPNPGPSISASICVDPSGSLALCLLLVSQQGEQEESLSVSAPSLTAVAPRSGQWWGPSVTYGMSLCPAPAITRFRGHPSCPAPDVGLACEGSNNTFCCIAIKKWSLLL